VGPEGISAVVVVLPAKLGTGQNIVVVDRGYRAQRKPMIGGKCTGQFSETEVVALELLVQCALGNPGSCRERACKRLVTRNGD
jgi:hypothetical protein